MDNQAQNVSESTSKVGAPHELIEFVIIQLIWALYCCTGRWTLNQGLRGLSFFVGLFHVFVENIWRGKLVYTTPWLATFWAGKLKFESSPLGVLRMVVFLLWMVTDLIVIWIDAVSWCNVAMEGLVVLGLILYQFTKINQLRRRREPGWGERLVWLCFWGVGWSVLAVICIMELTTSLPVIIWSFLYGQLFPDNVEEAEEQEEEALYAPDDFPLPLREEPIYDNAQF